MMAGLRKETTRITLADRLRSQREARGITKDAVAKALRIDRQTWYRIELGAASLPADRLIEVARVIGVTPNDLLGVS